MTSSSNLKRAFRLYNQKFFSGIIPDMPVMLRDTMYGLGSFECVLTETEAPFSISMVKGTGAIEISRQASDWRAILLHEMVHAYYATVGLGTEGHGENFQNKCRLIEEVFGREIPCKKP